MLPLLFLLASVLLSGAAGGEIDWGKEAKPHSQPYMASVKYYDNIKGWRRCGGFLVRDDFVMTAAHCFGRLRFNLPSRDCAEAHDYVTSTLFNSNMTVMLGAHNIRKKENSQQVIPMLRAFPHQDYDAERCINDIMLLKLAKKARIDQAVQTIALPGDQDWLKPRQVCSVAGWGETAVGKYADTLREVELEVQDGRECNNLFRNYNNSIQLCVGNPNSQKATGRGDSGGPFVCDGVAQGIVSYEYSKPEVLPRVFTRVSSFLPWIHTTMRCSWGNETSASRSQSPSHVWGLLSDSQ